MTRISDEMHIQNYSKSLEGTLKRVFPQSEFENFNHAFRIAISNGALEELDFVRPEGQSYNPRPARISQIIITDGQCTDPQSVVAAILLTVFSKLNSADIKKQFGSEVDQLLEKCSYTLETPISDDDRVGLIVSATWLDRMRHLHLRSPRFSSDSISDFIRQTEGYINLATASAPQIALLLSAWKDRFSRQNR